MMSDPATKHFVQGKLWRMARAVLNGRLSSSASQLILVGIFIILNIAALWIVFYRLLPEYPIGWDAPYYMSRVRYFEEQAVLSNRVGFISFMSLLHTVLGISLVKLHVIFTIAVTAMIAWASGLLASRVARARVLTFALVFFLVFWYEGYFALSITTFDNTLGLALSLLILTSIVFTGRDWKTAIPTTLLAVVLALTHLESFVFMIVIVGVYGLFVMAHERTIPRVLREYRFVLIGLAVAITLAYFQWSNIISIIVQNYAAPADPTGNASIPYSRERSLNEFFALAKTGLGQDAYVALFFLGVLSILLFTLRRTIKPRASLMVVAYFVASYGLLLFSVVRGSIPINRSVLLLPTPMAIGIGVSQLIYLLRYHFGSRTGILHAALLVAVIMPVPGYLSLARRFPVSIHPTVYEGLQNLRGIIARDHITHFVIITNTAPDVRAASAYYGLWRNWALSILPLPTATSDFCVYFGDVSSYRQGIPTQRVTNQEYNDTSIEGNRCLKTLPPGAPAYIIQALYPRSLPFTEASVTTREVAPYVWRVELDVGPSADEIHPTRPEGEE